MATVKTQTPLMLGENYIYPLTTADQVIIADGTRLMKNGTITADEAKNAAMLGGKAPQYYIQPRNLLDNSDFRNPVNQRGKTSYTTTWGMTIDRWYLGRSENITPTMTIGSDGITISNPDPSAGIALIQTRILPELIDASKTYTFACCTSDGTKKVEHYSSEHIQSAISYYGFAPFTLILDNVPSCTLVWAALYEGEYTADNLPPYRPKGYAAELAECRRYFQKYTRITFVGRNNQNLSFPLPVPMRTNPDFNYSDVYLAAADSSNVFDSYSDKCVPITDKTCVTLIQNFYNGFMSVTFAPVELNADL